MNWRIVTVFAATVMFIALGYLSQNNCASACGTIEPPLAEIDRLQTSTKGAETITAQSWRDLAEQYRKAIKEIDAAKLGTAAGSSNSRTVNLVIDFRLLSGKLAEAMDEFANATEKSDPVKLKSAQSKMDELSTREHRALRELVDHCRGL